MPGPDSSLTIAVVSYRRPERLAVLLPMLVAQAAVVSGSASPYDVRVLVVDNDPEGSAAAVAGAYGSEVTYELEARPGISAARNHALDAAGTDLLVFIDDDETPVDGWLRALLATVRREHADAVAGPVLSRPEGPVDPFIDAGGFHERAHRSALRTGDGVTRAATNNLLLDLRTVRRLGLRFDERFGLSGGEDSLFTGTLTSAGGRIVWCAEAVVHDHVPADRLTRDYVVRRTESLANATLLVELTLARSASARSVLRVRALARESARALQGGVLLGAGLLVGSIRSEARGRRALARSRGSFAALMGRQRMAYARPVTPVAAPVPGT